MKHKVKMLSLILCASLITTGMAGGTPMSVRAEQVTAYEATVSPGDSRSLQAVLPEGAVQVYGKEVTFDATSTWDDKGEHNIALTTTEALHKGAYVTMDVLVPEEAQYGGIMKVQGVARLGSNWSWTQAPAIAELTAGDFVSVGNGYKSAGIRFDFDEAIEADALAQFTIKLAGYQCDYSGAVYIANVKLVDGVTQGNDSVTNEPIAEITDRVQMYGQDVTFDVTSDWNDKGEHNIALTTTEALHKGAYVTMDVLVSEEAQYGGIMKVQGIARLGSNWSWTQAPGIAELTPDDFVSTGDGYKSAGIRFDFDEAIEADALAQFTIKLAGYQCDYSGAVYIENVKLYDGQASAEEEPLPEKEPMVVDDFEDGTCEDWFNGGSWQYDGNIAIGVSEYSGSKMMEVALDYTGMGDYSWSEAKVQNTFAEAFDISAYNLLSFEYYYPEAFAGSKIKLFSNGVINGEVEFVDQESIDGGYKKATAQLKFSPTNTGLSDLTIGFVGVNTEFAGKVYIDNIYLSQFDANKDYVEITSVPGEGATADISKAPSTVKTADAAANDAAKALYAYLTSLKECNQVLFGHQNDYNKMVSRSATQGDVKEITGSLSGIFGIDSLALTGAELGIADAQQALDAAIAVSIDAAEGGSIVSLSTHMPNFTNKKILVNEDGTYDFTACNFMESKDLTGNCAEQILPGGAYNATFNAYLDIIAEYAKALQEKNIPILFRPFHENNGNWFWWGSSTDVETYKSIFRYMEEYLQQSGVHNLLYVYSPNGPFNSADEYMERYPGDEYIDILAFDYYDDYYTYPAISDGSFFEKLQTTCEIVTTLARERGKLSAISETGVRAMKKNGTDVEGLLLKENPVAKSKTGVNWYQKIHDIAAECDMPYWLVWANFSDTNFYVPYKYNETHGHEMINEFIDFYNCDNAIFANGTNFYGKMGAVSGEAYHNPQGYMVAPFEQTTIENEMTFCGSVINASEVSFVVENAVMGTKCTLEAVKVENGSHNLYEAKFTTAHMEQLGATDRATVSLVADGTVLATVGNISFGIEANIIENFDYYGSNEALLQKAYSTNSANGCSSEFMLNTENKASGAYGGAFCYRLNTDGSEVWTGQIKDLHSVDLSAYNSLSMWVKPDGKAQKVVIQLADSSGEEFEAYLTAFAAGTEAKYITIPFSTFVGKQNGTLNTEEITRFAIWCNSIIPEEHSGEWKVDSVLYFDSIAAYLADEELLAKVDENGLIITDNQPGSTPEPEETPELEETPKPEVTSKPEVTPEPEVTPKPEVTPGPKETPEPEATSKPEDSSPAEKREDSTNHTNIVSWNGIKNAVEKELPFVVSKRKEFARNINLVVGNGALIEKDILNKIKGQNVTLAFHTGDGITFSANGMDMQKADSAIDLSLRKGNNLIPDSVLARELGTATVAKEFEMLSKGPFGVKLDVHVSLGKANAGKFANLYSYDKVQDTMRYLGSFPITENGQAMFAMPAGAIYAVTVTDGVPKNKNVPQEYIIQKGDSLTEIAKRFGIKQEELWKNNPHIANPDKIYVGQRLYFKWYMQ